MSDKDISRESPGFDDISALYHELSKELPSEETNQKIIQFAKQRNPIASATEQKMNWKLGLSVAASVMLVSVVYILNSPVPDAIVEDSILPSAPVENLHANEMPENQYAKRDGSISREHNSPVKKQNGAVHSLVSQEQRRGRAVEKTTIDVAPVCELSDDGGNTLQAKSLLKFVDDKDTAIKALLLKALNNERSLKQFKMELYGQVTEVDSVAFALRPAFAEAYQQTLSQIKQCRAATGRQIQ